MNFLKIDTREMELWMQSLCLACYIYILVAIYIGGLEGLTNPRFVNLAMGHTGFLMVILSMGMSSITYYWHVAEHSMIFRKYFGIIGCVFVLFHFCFSLLLIEQRSSLHTFVMSPANTIPFFTGVVAFLILLFMTIISHRLAVKYLGGQLWRNLLRLGYMALILSFIHVMWRNWDSWLRWMTGKSELLFPPMGLLVSLAALIVCVLRVAMLFGHKKNP